MEAAANDHSGGVPASQMASLRASGLLAATVPQAYGGGGAPLSVAMQITRKLAQADGSIAHLFGYQNNILHGAHMYGSPEQAERWYTATASGEVFWSNSGNSQANGIFGVVEADCNVVNGVSPFSSGTHVADLIQVTWLDKQTGRKLTAPVRADQPGVRVMHDWDGFGQRQTGSGSVRFENVLIPTADVYARSYNEGLAIQTLTPLLQQSVLTNVFVGCAVGALAEARLYSRDRARPWVDSGVERHSDDPGVQRRFGELFSRLRAAETIADSALKSLDEVWEAGRTLTPTKRGEAAVKIAAANIFAGEVALDVTSSIFEVMGARSATRANNFDRYWRNVRIHTLHNPAEYKARNVGRWFLTGEPPVPDVFR